MSWTTKFFLCGELALPLPGGSHQPRDRQTWFYCDPLRLASEACRIPQPVKPRSSGGRPPWLSKKTA